MRTVQELGPISVRDLTATALAGKQRRVGAAAAACRQPRRRWRLRREGGRLTLTLVCWAELGIFFFFSCFPLLLG